MTCPHWHQVRGEYLLQAPRDWGAGHHHHTPTALPACTKVPVVLADPTPACQQDITLQGGGGEGLPVGLPPAIVLVPRGMCTFVEKAKNVQRALAHTVAGPGAGAPSNPGAGEGALGDPAAGGGALGVPGAGEEALGDSRAGAGAGAGSGEVGAMVLLNTEDVLADMPAGNLLTDDVTIAVAMSVQ
ncbi:unnamed protein product [Discosporangium mesarthrocarpum]